MRILQCGLITVLLNALPVLLSGQSYIVSETGTYNIEIDNPTFISVDQDNATQIPVGFNFSFFGVSYSECWVGGDGFIAFGDFPDPSCCGQYVPDISTPNNLIAVAWTNVDWISAHYELFGSAPNRRLVITYDLRNPCDSVYYGQVKLFESTNVIEIQDCKDITTDLYPPNILQINNKIYFKNI